MPGYYEGQPRKNKGKVNNTCKPPRQREGKVFAGGRHRRRALAKLEARNKAHEATMATNQAAKRYPGCFTRPGSMQ